MNMGHLKESWQHNKAILQNAKEEFAKEYNRRHDMDRNEAHMKIFSPDVQLERMANQLIAKMTDDAQRDTTNDATPTNRIS